MGESEGSKRRSRSEELNRETIETDEFLTSHLQLLCENYGKRISFSSEDTQFQDVQVWQTDCPLSPRKPRPLHKIGSVMCMSNSSVSTMAPEDDDAHLGKFRNVDSSDSLSTMAWGEEDEELDFSSDSVAVKSDPKPNPCEIATQTSLLTAPKDSKHCFVPKNVNLAEEFAKSKKDGQVVTTVMIRNIPNRCSQRELINELDSVGFAGCFDFLYIPLDLGTMSNVGYAFVNFTHPQYASRCMEILPRHHFKRQRKVGKGVAVSAAHMQGLEANLKHYEKSAVNTSRLRQRRPVVMNILKQVSLASLI